MKNDIPVLIIDDEAEMLESEALALQINGHANVLTCSDPRKALEIIQGLPACVAVLDITMPHLNGMELLAKITEHHPEVTSIMMTGLNDVETAVRCLKLGAFDYLLKPVDQNRFITTIGRALEHKLSQAQSARLARGVLEDTLSGPQCFAAIATRERRLMNIFKYIEAVAPTSLPVLLTGETGVGKELFANAVHAASGRTGEFVCVNSAGIDDAMFSDSLFGHASGAYTGAQKDRKGLIDRAKNGTLFLDEIGDMKPESQVKLLRLLQEGTYYRLGQETEERTNARIVAATNRSLDELQADPRFRKDLFYRLKAHHVHIPPLRERMEDVPLLTERFLDQCAREQNKAKPTAPPELEILLSNYPFPGNVRELRGMVYDAVSRHQGGVLSIQSFKDAIGGKHAGNAGSPRPRPAGPGLSFPFPLPTVKDAEIALIREALKRTAGNKTLASEMIGMARQTFRTKVKDFNIQAPAGPAEDEAAD
ncbi:MAG: two component, sigma54 specific, transcriptional regulator, Fis family [Fibrobacteres bacterium]|nr:two component, sigma54 specific, transcriptional regulator, Fis family [Fibrobacterota bacterium]